MISYQEVIPHSKKRPDFQYDASKTQGFFEFIGLSLNNSTWLALGATLQAALVLLPVPKHYALAPGVLFLLSRIMLTCLISFNVIANPYLKGVIPFRYTAIVPDDKGNFPAQDEVPTNQKIAVLILCARVNHPAGWLGAPHVMRFGELFEAMNDDLRELGQEESGLLGHTQAVMPTPEGASEVLNISYWRTKEHIHKFADRPSHRKAVQWWSELGAYDGKGGKIPHIGIGHEIYESEPGKWESVYMGYQPTLLGATSYLRKGDQYEKGVVPDEWVSPVIAARRGKLASSRGRMGVTTPAKFATAQM